MKRALIICFLFFLGCQSRDVKPKGTGTEYYPLRVGTFWIYDVSETIITQLGGQTNTAYELKIQIVDSTSSDGQVIYRMLRYSRSDSSQPWASIDTWSSHKDPFQAILQEGNISYVKLSFPLANEKTWNGNALNNEGGVDQCADGTFHCENYVVTDLARPFQAPGVSYDDSVTIFENNEDDPIVRKDIRKSVYAKSIGLVYREGTVLEYCTIGICIGKQIVENGTIVKQTLKDYGGS